MKGRQRDLNNDPAYSKEGTYIGDLKAGLVHLGEVKKNANKQKPIKTRQEEEDEHGRA